MKMIAISMNLDTRKLDHTIREFKKENGYDPTIWMHYETFLAIDPLDRSEESIKIDELISYKQAYYINNRVYFDNSLPIGVAEVR